MARKKPKTALTEVDVAKPVVEHLGAMGWTVYQEVQPDWGSCVADIVATMQVGRVLVVHVVEVKRSLTFSVLAQAARWQPFAHYVTVAVKGAPDSNGRRFAKRCMREYGIGLLNVFGGPISDDGVGSVPPRLNSWPRPLPCRKGWPDILCDEQKTWAPAGSANGNHFTTYRRTVVGARKILTEHGPLTAKELVKLLDHHYASDQSARQCLINGVRKGWIDGIAIDETAKPFKLRACALRDKENAKAW